MTDFSKEVHLNEGFSHTYSADLIFTADVDNAIDDMIRLYLNHFTAQIGSQLKMIDQITLIGQGNTVGASREVCT